MPIDQGEADSDAYQARRSLDSRRNSNYESRTESRWLFSIVSAVASSHLQSKRQSRTSSELVLCALRASQDE